MLRNRATWRSRMNDILKQKNIYIEEILKINEMLYDEEVRELVQWLLYEENVNVDKEDICKQINVIRR